MQQDKPLKVFRLSQEDYLRFAKQFPLHVSKETTDIVSGQMLGQQQVLEALRRDFVVGA